MRFVLVLIVLSQLSYAQDVPRALETAHLVGNGLATGTPPVETQDDFYNLGFSKDGLFAYLVHHYAPGEEYEFFVQDLVLDRIVESKSFQDSDLDISVWWARHKDEIQIALNNRAIERNDFQLGLFPAIFDDDYFTFKLKPIRSRTDSPWIESIVGNVHSSEKGTKTVFRKSGPFRWVKFLGFIPSPEENRIALIVLAQPFGWKGTDQSLRFLVFGSSLQVGFSGP